MDFELTDEQKTIKKAAREFAEAEFTEVAEECDREEKFPKDVWEKAVQQGFIGMGIPEEYGGPGMGMMESCLVIEEFFRVDAGCGLMMATTFGSELIMMFGTDEQKEKYLPKLATGDLISGAAITEPDCGSDVAGIKTKAKKDGDEWVINGTKQFITNGTIADFLVTLARTDPDAEKRSDGLTVFIVPTDTDAVQTDKLEKLGIRASPTAEVSLNDVRVPEKNIIGDVNDGFGLFMFFFNLTRIPVAFQAVGFSQGAFEQAYDYAQQRETWEEPLVEKQVIQEKLADMYTEISSARLLARRAAWKADQGNPDPGITAMAKAKAGETATMVAEQALQIHGGYGFTYDYPISRFYRDAKIFELYEGTTEIEKDVVQRSIRKQLPSSLSKEVSSPPDY